MPFATVAALAVQVNMTRRQFAELTPEEKFELSLPELIRKAAIDAEQTPDRREQLHYAREITVMQRLAEETKDGRVDSGGEKIGWLDTSS